MFLTMQEQEDRVSKGLATKKINSELGLVTYKYSRKVMFDNLWESENMYECRGHTYDIETGELVLAAPRKTYNYLENGTWADIDLDTPVYAYHKYNGFMATATVWKDQLIVGTTGTTTSDYAKLAKQRIIESGFINEGNISGFGTWLYEIVDESDPHIVDDPVGVHYLGFRYTDGKLVSKYRQGMFNPEGECIETTLRDILKLAETSKHEGWMVYTTDFRNCCKIKTDYYIGKKKLMRMTDKNVDMMYNHGLVKQLPRSWFDIRNKIVQTVQIDIWKSWTDQQRRKYIELQETI